MLVLRGVQKTRFCGSLRLFSFTVTAIGLGSVLLSRRGYRHASLDEGKGDAGRSIQNTTVLQRCDTRSTSRDIRVGVQVFFGFPPKPQSRKLFKLADGHRRQSPVLVWLQIPRPEPLGEGVQQRERAGIREVAESE